MQHKRGTDKGEGFDGAVADIMQPTSHMLTVEVSLTLQALSISHSMLGPVTNRDTATSHVTGPYVYKSIVSLCFFFSLNINCDTPLNSHS